MTRSTARVYPVHSMNADRLSIVTKRSPISATGEHLALVFFANLCRGYCHSSCSVQEHCLCDDAHFSEGCEFDSRPSRCRGSCSHPRASAGRSGLVVACWLQCEGTQVRISATTTTAIYSLGHGRLHTLTVVPMQADSAFHPPWDGKMSIRFRAE